MSVPWTKNSEVELTRVGGEGPKNDGMEAGRLVPEVSGLHRRDVIWSGALSFADVPGLGTFRNDFE